MPSFFKVINLIFSHTESAFVFAILIRSEIIGIFDFVRQIVLLDPIARLGVRVEIVLCVAQFLTAGIVAVA